MASQRAALLDLHLSALRPGALDRAVSQLSRGTKVNISSLHSEGGTARKRGALTLRLSRSRAISTRRFGTPAPPLLWSSFQAGGAQENLKEQVL